VDECEPLGQGGCGADHVLCGGGGGGGRVLRGAGRGGQRGRAVQVHPMKSKLKPPGTKRLKLKCDIMLSTSAFKFNLRRYSEEILAGYARHAARPADAAALGWAVQVDPIKPTLKPPGTERL